jgi:hypothetical protein
MAEVRVFSEGALRWVQASGATANPDWVTASAAPTALVGFVQVGTRETSGQTVTTIANRGIPDHHKVTQKDPIELQITFLEAVTANNPALVMLTASGTTVPMVHMELKSDTKEVGATSAIYRQYHFCALVTNQWSEADEGNQCQQTWRALKMVGPTASGYIA